MDNTGTGAAWIFTRTNGSWTQQGPKLVGTGAIGLAFQGGAVAVSADGNAAVVGGGSDNSGTGAAWIFTRTNGVWSQQAKLVGTGAAGRSGQGSAVAISGDGNTIVVGGLLGDNGSGAAWIFTQANGVWTQQGSQLVGSGALSSGADQGWSVSLSADGNTAAVGGFGDSNGEPAAWIFTRSNGVWTQQGPKLFGIDVTTSPVQNLSAEMSVSLSANGNTLVLGGDVDNTGTGATWVFTRATGVWTQQGPKLVGTGAVGLARQGGAVSVSGDGNTLIEGGRGDNGLLGATWVFTRNNGVWTQLGPKLVGGGAIGPALQGSAVAISSDATTAIVGSRGDETPGAAWIFAAPPPVAAVGVSPAAGIGLSRTFTFTFSDKSGWQNLSVVNVLINNVLDGRQACYIAYVPSGPSSGSVFLVDDAGDAGGPFSGMVLPGNNTVENSQCSISGFGSSSSSAGNTITLTLGITFAALFSGNKVIYLAARDATSNSGWQPLGTWSVPGTPMSGPGVGAVNPNRSTGVAQTYTFTFTDTNGWQDIAVANVLINNAINGINACYLALAPGSAGSGALLLVDDAGDAGGPFAGVLLPSINTISNSQCTVGGQGSSVTMNGNTLALTLPISFIPGQGNRIIYLSARSNTLNSGWQAVGSVSIP